jgi:hypothetical protein
MELKIDNTVKRFIVNLIFAIYWMTILDGMLRKWLFPKHSNVIFFMKDPVVIFTYILALKYHLFPTKNRVFILGMALAAIFLLLIFVQAVFLKLNTLVLIYGWRMYFLYIPIVFIIGNIFEKSDLDRLMKQTLLAAIPIGILVYMQFLSPMNAFINKAMDPVSKIYYVVSGIVRTSGTFTFYQGQVLFTASAIAFIFYAWISKRNERFIGPFSLICASYAVIACFALSGSRAVFFNMALIFFAAESCVALLKSRESKTRTALIPIMIVFLGAFVFTMFFNTSLAAILERQIVAVGIEGQTSDRLTNQFSDFAKYLLNHPIGAGVGIGTTGGGFLQNGSPVEIFNARVRDIEWSRIILEAGPIAGLSFVVFRVIIVFYLLIQAMTATRRSGDTLPMLLMGFIGIILLIGEITNHGTINSYAWLFAGFCMAANKIGADRSVCAY